MDEEALQALLDMVRQHCDEDWHKQPSHYFSGFISANADAMRLLGKRGLLNVIDSGGRNVCATEAGVKHIHKG